VNEPARIEPLGSHHDRAGFSSGVERLDRYFHRQAGQDQQKRVAATFVLAAGTRVLGYYTLSATSVALAELPESIAKKLPKYPVVPATLLGRLAVSRMHRGQGFGEFLLLDALRRSLEHSREVASFAVIVDAKDDLARSFYEAHGFLAFPSSPLRQFLPIATIAKLF
jgi:predicted GNAT family N-acyltransferase